MADEVLSQNVVVQNPQGLHVRPAEVVAKAATQFESRISLELNGHKIDAKSILHIMTLGAQQGSLVVIEACGADARQAVELLAELIGSDFESDNGDSVTQDRAG